MTPDHYSTSAPGSLLALLDKHAGKVKRIELWRRQGQSGPQPIGRRWELDEDDDPEDVARTVFDEAELHYSTEGGGKEKRYRAVLQLDNDEEKHAEFSVTGTPSGAAVDGAQAHWIVNLTQDRRDLAKELLLMAREIRRVSVSVVDMVPGLVELRMDAFEDQLEALAPGSGRKGSYRVRQDDNDKPGDWKPAADAVKEAIRAFAPAAAVSAFNLTPEQIAALGLSLGTDDPDDVRSQIRKLGASLTDEQKSKLAKSVGGDVLAELVAIAGLDDETAARKRGLALFQKLESKFDELIKPLDDEQKQIVSRIAELVDEPVDGS